MLFYINAIYITPFSHKRKNIFLLSKLFSPLFSFFFFPSFACIPEKL